MIPHELLLEMIAHVKAVKDAGQPTASISGLPSFLYSLNLPMEHCAMSATGGKLVCIMDTDRLLAVLEKRKVRYEN